MNRRRLLIVFVLAVLLLLPLLLPLRLALDWAAHDAGLPIRAGEVSGSLWNGRLRNARWGTMPLDEIRLRLRPLPLLYGRRQWVVESERLRATLVQGSRYGLRDANGGFDLGDRVWPGAELRLGLSGATVLFHDGRCEQAAGTVSLELLVLESAANSSPTQPIRLDGRLTCNDDSTVAELAPTGALPPELESVTVRLRIDPAGAYTATAHLRTDAPALQLALQAAGFEGGDRDLSRSKSGRLLR